MSRFRYRGSRPVVVAKWTGTVLAALAVLVFVGFIVLALVDWNALRGPVGRYISAKSGRPVSIEGHLDVHLWSLTPKVTAERITVGNPSWESKDAPPMASVDRLSMSVRLLPLFKFDIVMPEVVLEQPRIYLHRETSGRANWQGPDTQRQPKKASEPLNLPTVQRFFVRGGKLEARDELRKLKFKGDLDARERAESDDAQAFHLKGEGELNEKPFSLDVHGGPLINLDPDKPYDFDGSVHASTLNLDARGKIRKPFDLATLTVATEISGHDLADFYYLTGLALPNTKPFKLSATVDRSEKALKITKVVGQVGGSDVSGELTVETDHARPKLTGTLRSKQLDIADLGATLGTQVPGSRTAAGMKAAGKTPAPDAPPPLLLPDAHLQVNRVRNMDADVHYKAGAINAGKVPMRDIAMHVVLDNGTMKFDPLTLTLPQGKLDANVRIDATQDVPRANADLRMTDVHLEQFRSSKMNGQPPVEGTMQARAQLSGTGDSVHEVASNASGTLTAVVPKGDVRAVFAELTGINVAKGLGLLITKDQDSAKVRCGIAAFKIENGDMKAQNIVFDTEHVLITGGGEVKLKSEQLDLSLQGHPKELRFFRVRTPIVIGGHLSKPSIGVKADKLAGQAGVAAAIGAIVAPLAAVVAFVDPGLAKDANCAALFAEAKDKGTPQTGENKAGEGETLSQPGKHPPK